MLFAYKTVREMNEGKLSGPEFFMGCLVLSIVIMVILLIFGSSKSNRNW